MPNPRITEEEMLSRLERESLETADRVRAVLREQGRPDLVKWLDEKLLSIERGIDGAQRTWEALSMTQRRIVSMMAERGFILIRNAKSSVLYDAVCAGETIPKAARLSTVRNLGERKLIAWDGGALDPEKRAVLTERGRFVHAQSSGTSTPESSS